MTAAVLAVPHLGPIIFEEKPKSLKPGFVAAKII
jgi:hypothetical protein